MQTESADCRKKGVRRALKASQQGLELMQPIIRSAVVMQAVGLGEAGRAKR